MKVAVLWCWHAAIALCSLACLCLVAHSEEMEHAPYLGQQVSGVDAIRSLIGKEGSIQELQIDGDSLVFTARNLPSFGVSLVEVGIWSKVRDSMELVFIVRLKNAGKPKIVYDKETRSIKMFATLNSYLKDKEILSLSYDALTRS